MMIEHELQCFRCNSADLERIDDNEGEVNCLNCGWISLIPEYTLERDDSFFDE